MGYIILGIIVAVLVGLIIFLLFRGNTASRLAQANAKRLEELLKAQEKVQEITWNELQRTKEERDALIQDLDVADTMMHGLESTVEEYKNRA